MHGAPVQTSTLHARPTADHVPRLDPVVIAGMREGERQTPEVDQVLPMDAGKALGDHHLEAEITWRKRSVVAARSLSVVLAGDNGMSLVGPDLLGSPRIALIDGLECELARQFHSRIQLRRT